MKNTSFLSSVLLSGAVMACCTPPAVKAPPPQDCEGYECTVPGAKKMLTDVAKGSGEWSASATAQLNQLFDKAAARMSSEGQLTPDGFRKARGNFQKLVASLPSGIDDPAPRAIEKTRQGNFSVCPLWPFC